MKLAFPDCNEMDQETFIADRDGAWVSMRTKMVVALGLSLAAGGIAAAADPFSPLVRQPVLEAVLPRSNPVVRRVRGAHIRFAPGQPTGLHYHPESTVGVVTEGSFRFQAEGQPERIIGTGDTFFEPANHRIVHFDNTSATRPAAITVFYLVDSKNRPLITMLDK